ncbi:MAG: prolyl oligopeptidase family serine peptidase [Candidatus Gottesmanbacteria bacterium]|nr:prolyl oligopeptidase family serine peptidase [Candidatus Gottesmanbacteria bacterium]
MAHIPNGENQKFPVIVQFRGYVDREQYFPGEGTARSAEVYAANGFISLAPDFLGYGGSDMPSTDVFEERFETYTTALNLLASVSTLPIVDALHIGIWGHSNGGQIALTVLEILGRPIPTVLWAPVSKPFPYSILYYTDEADDHGKLLRRELARFESQYDIEQYSLTNYLNRITGPVQFHQGMADTAVPLSWSDTLAKTLEASNSAVNYFVYPGADHNMLPDGWDTVVARDVTFFGKYLR